MCLILQHPELALRDRLAQRREEVARLANVGLTWYTWLEQGRQARPSASVLTAIADARSSALPAAALTCSWQSVRTGHRGFGLYCAATATTMLATMALAGAGFNQSPRLVNLAGLFQRASIVTGFGWLTAVSAQALTRAPAASARKPST